LFFPWEICLSGSQIGQGVKIGLARRRLWAALAAFGGRGSPKAAAGEVRLIFTALWHKKRYAVGCGSETVM